MKTNGLGPWSSEKGRRFRTDEISRIKESIRLDQEINPDGEKIRDPNLIAIIKKRNRKRKEYANG